MNQIHQRIKLLKRETLCLKRCLLEAEGDIKNIISRHESLKPRRLEKQVTLNHLFVHEDTMNHKSELLQQHLRRCKYIIDEIIADTGEEDYSPIMEELKEWERDRSRILMI